ncbi:MAG: IS110 family transposase [Gammaproteobacteria bacterium]|nr:IS110 family transposase [Gammaproteobacteria bacterium]
MAMLVKKTILGCDVSQDWLDLCRYGDDETTQIRNNRRDIDSYLKGFAAGATAIAVEATNVYHELFVERAQRLGFTVYLISGYQLKHYANSLNTRMRTDAVDAQLLARFLDREIDDLRPYEPRAPQHQRLIRLLKRRALLVNQRQQLSQSFAGLAELRSSVHSLRRRLQEFIKLIERRMHKLARELGWQNDLARLRTLPGVGPLNALALCAIYFSGQFIHRDPFIAFIGLDVRTKDSGKHTGRRKLTKKGEPEYRRLLHNAAMAATKKGRYFHEEYQRLQARGLCKIAALVVIARKIARLAFSLLRNQSTFDPLRHQRRCIST